MRVVVPQITWHNRLPILSVDFDPTAKGGDGGFYRVATGGGDNNVLVWRLAAADTLKPEFTVIAELKRHDKPLNVVRFSPDGTLIGSGGDDAYLILWNCSDKNERHESWHFEKTLRKHIEDVSDLSWSPDGLFLLSASIDNSAVLWDVKKGISLYIWNEKEHSGFVHGVAYDPLHEFAATICIDRTLRFFDLKTKKTAHKAFKYPEEWISPELQQVMDNEEKENNNNSKKKASTAAVVADDDVNIVNNMENHQDAAAAVAAPTTTTKNKAPMMKNRLFQDEFLQTFCRRLSFSPRGELLLVPGGLLPPGQSSSSTDAADKSPNKEDGDKIKGTNKDNKKTAAANKKTSYSSNNATIVFCRHSWMNPCAVIPTLDSYSIATRFCPIYFKRNRQPYVYDQSMVYPKKSERSFASINKLASPKEENNSNPLMRMPYRLVYAIATNDTVIIGDTASSTPLAVVRSIHLARITDVTWAADGLALMVSSTDEYCSLITFGKGELGEEFVLEPDQPFPTLTRDCFPVLPAEPKPEKLKKKSIKPAKDNTTTTMDANNKGETQKTPTAKKKETVKKQESAKKQETTPQSNQIKAMFSAISASSSSSAQQKSGNEPTQSNKIYPMTPPKAIAVRRVSTSIISPLVSSSSSLSYSSTPTNGSVQQKRQQDITPEELHRLTTAPIKCRRIMEQEQRTPIMESSPRSATAPTTTFNIFNNGAGDTEPASSSSCVPVPAASTQTPCGQKISELSSEQQQIIASPKVTDPNCPPSPISSSSNTPRAPRRISLVTLLPATENNAGKLD